MISTEQINQCDVVDTMHLLIRVESAFFSIFLGSYAKRGWLRKLFDCLTFAAWSDFGYEVIHCDFFQSFATDYICCLQSVDISYFN